MAMAAEKDSLHELEKIHNYIESYNSRGPLLSFSILPKSTTCW